VSGDERSVVPGRWQDQDDVDSVASVERAGDRRSLVRALTDDRLERAHVRLHLHQDDLVSSLEPEVGRAAAWPRHGRLQRGPPARMASAEDRLHDPCVRRIVDQRRIARIDRDPEVGSERGRAARADPRRDVRVALLQAADHGPRDADRAGQCGLADARAETDLPDLLAEPDAGSPELTIAVVDGEAADCVAGRDHDLPPWQWAA
jgi:hypothetical protein